MDNSAWPQGDRPWTVGVEEEFLVVDASTGAICDAAPLLAADEVDEQVELDPELATCCVEVQSRPYVRADRVVEDLDVVRAEVAARAERVGLSVAGAGMHPDYDHDEVELTDTPHYRHLARRFPWVARESTTYGMHVHVGVPSADEAVHICNALRPALPVLVALGANSPLHRGEPAGVQSLRSVVASVFPRSGIPPRFDDHADYLRAIEVLGTEIGERGRASRKPVWWLVRPHDVHGTVEVRVFDSQTRLETVGALAAFTQAVVREVATRPDLGLDVPDHVIDENLWIAAHEGIHGDLVLAGGRTAPVAAIVDDLIERVGPWLTAFGNADYADVIRELARRSPADEQLERAHAGDDVVAWLCGQFARVLV